MDLTNIRSNIRILEDLNTFPFVFCNHLCVYVYHPLRNKCQIFL